MTSIEDRFLETLARGGLVSQAEYDQMCQDLPPDLLAQALARRFNCTGDTRALVAAANLYHVARLPYETLEVCSRAPRVSELQRMIQKVLPVVQRAYPGERMVGKLMEEAFLVIDLRTGKIIRFPPLLPAR
jgi:hypothetical protein